MTNQIITKKYLGDDEYSWAVFKNGKSVITGLSKREAQYHKREIEKLANKKESI